MIEFLFTHRTNYLHWYWNVRLNVNFIFRNSFFFLSNQEALNYHRSYNSQEILRNRIRSIHSPLERIRYSHVHTRWNRWESDRKFEGYRICGAEK